MSSRQAAWCWLLALILGISVFPARLSASNGGVVTLPIAGKKVKNGLQVTLDTRWVDTNGYRPVKVRVSTVPPLPAPADRTLRLVMKFYGYRGGYRTPTVTSFVEIPQGATAVDATVSIPLNDTWVQVEMEVSEDGRKLEDLSDRVGLPLRGYGEWSESLPGILVVHSGAARDSMTAAWPNVMPVLSAPTPESTPRKLPDVRGLAMLFLHQQSYETQQLQTYFVRDEINDLEVQQIFSVHSRMDLRHPLDLPDRWSQYSCLDLVLIPYADLLLLNREGSPSKAEALRLWTAAGGTLVVYDVGPNFERLESLERELQLRPVPGGALGTHRGWRLPAETAYTAVVAGMGNANNVTFVPNPNMAVPTVVSPEVMPPRPDSPPFVERDFDLGRVVAFAEAQPIDKTNWRWRYLLNSLTPDAWSWYRRHGVSLNRPNRDYWNWLIAGVGKTPVLGFLVLITVFVVITGPINYHLLRRRHRLSLLLVTVPAAAGIVTFALFGYAVVHDGLGVRVRIRSVTHLDQRSGRAVSWSRQTYYAGLTPSEGLVFPLDTVVYPVDANPSNSHRSFNATREVAWSDEQVLRRGYVTPRTMTQLLVGHGENSDLRLAVLVPASPDEPLRVTNHLGTRLPLVALKDESGQLYWGETIEVDATVALKKIAAEELAGHWKLQAFDRELQLPADLNPEDAGRSYWFSRNRVYYWSNVDNGLAEPTFRTSILETQVRMIESADPAKLEPGAYWAVAERSPWVPVGYSRARQQGSWHLIRGRW